MIEEISKSDRLVPIHLDIQERGIDGYSASISDDDGDGGEIGYDSTSPTGEIDLNFYPLLAGPIKSQIKPHEVPYLDIHKVLLIKYRRSKGLSVAHLCD